MFGDVFTDGQSAIKLISISAPGDSRDSAENEKQSMTLLSRLDSHFIPVEHSEQMSGTHIAQLIDRHLPRSANLCILRKSYRSFDRYLRVKKRRQNKYVATVSCEGKIFDVPHRYLTSLYDHYCRCETVMILRMPLMKCSLLQILSQLTCTAKVRVVFQIMWSLTAAQLSFPDFRHNDLTLDNVFIENKPSSQLSYQLNDDKWTFSSGATAVIGDLGLCSNVAGVPYCVRDKTMMRVQDTKGDRPCPQFDMVTVCDDLRQTMFYSFNQKEPKNPLLRKLMQLTRECAPPRYRNDRFTDNQQRLLKTKGYLVSWDGGKVNFATITPKAALYHSCFLPFRDDNCQATYVLNESQ